MTRACEVHVYWSKQIVAVACGLSFGVYDVRGWNGFLGFLAAALFVTFIVYARIHRLDLEELGVNGQAVFWQEGMGPGLGVFMLCWVVSFNLLGQGAGALDIPVVPPVAKAAAAAASE